VLPDTTPIKPLSMDHLDGSGKCYVGEGFTYRTQVYETSMVVCRPLCCQTLHQSNLLKWIIWMAVASSLSEKASPIRTQVYETSMVVCRPLCCQTLHQANILVWIIWIAVASTLSDSGEGLPILHISNLKLTSTSSSNTRTPPNVFIKLGTQEAPNHHCDSSTTALHR